MKLWRYIQYSKFVSMLKDNALHFSRADKFVDAFEGSYPHRNMSKLAIVANPVFTYGSYKKYAALSCWHSNPDESEAMWDLYLKNTDGVAIVTDKKTLEMCLEDSDVNIVQIHYLDFARDEIDDFCWFKAFEYKRKCFKHEREVRAAIYRLPPTQRIVNGFPEPGPPDGAGCIPEYGVKIEIDLSKLIKKIVISPRSGAWFECVVRDTLDKYSLGKIKVLRSELANDPLYPDWVV